jgi:hypothetical protein
MVALREIWPVRVGAGWGLLPRPGWRLCRRAGWDSGDGLPVTPALLGMRTRMLAWRWGLDLRVGHCCLEIAWVTVALRDLRVRDDAWARVDPAQREAHRAAVNRRGQRTPGRSAVKFRFTRSGARMAAGSGIVVRTVRARVTPRHPFARISRSTVHRATVMPCRFSCSPHLQAAVQALRRAAAILVRLVDPGQDLGQRRVGQRPLKRRPGPARPVRPRGDLDAVRSQGTADRHDPEPVRGSVDERADQRRTAPSVTAPYPLRRQGTGRPRPPADERKPIVVQRVEYASNPAFTEQDFPVG